MPDRFLNLSTDNTLGGDYPSAEKAVSEKVVKEYVDNNFVTLGTTQKIQAAKAIFGTDVAFGSDTTQKNLLAVISNSNSTAGNWIGRMSVGAKNKTFIMGTYGSICVLGAHSWSNAQQGTGAAWEDVYINPDGNKTVYIGGSPINGKQALMKITNVSANTTGRVLINRSTNLTSNFKDAACWDDDVRKFSFTSISGYALNTTQVLKNVNGTLTWGDDSGGGTVDQNFDETSENAQSGIAIAGVLEDYVETDTSPSPALTPTNGVVTWRFTNSFGHINVSVDVINTSTGKVVDVEKTITTSTITIKFLSAANLSAGNFLAVVKG